MSGGKADITFSSEDAANYCMEYLNHAYFKSKEIKISNFLPAERRMEMRKWKLKVEKLPINVDLFHYFSKFGEIHTMSIHNDRRNNEPYLALQYMDKNAADLALADKSGMVVSIMRKPLIKFPEGSQIMEITGLPDDMNELELKKLVSKYGNVKNIYMNQKINGDDKIYNFVNFGSRRQRKNAIKELDGKRLNKCTIHASRLLEKSPFYQGEKLEEGDNNYFKPSKGKYYIEFINPPDDLDEHKIKSICCKYGVIYDVSIDSKTEGIDYKCSHVGFSTKGQMRKALKDLATDYNVKRLSKNSPFFKC